jgi:small GTP-binding protein
MSLYQENIHIAILGPVSAGKSTLLNGLFATTYSQMKKKRTTMMPNIYQTTFNEKDVDSFVTIQKKNEESNNKIFKLRESNQYNHTHFEELIHKVKPIEDFIELPDKNCTYKINDLPGINDQDAQIYYDYVKNNSHNIDVYILVFDINSPLNRTDEVKILQEITSHVKNNNHGYVHILINKCDDITFDAKDKFTFNDEENQESFDECVKTINKFMKDIMDRVTISPLRSSLLYTYRTAIYNMDKLEEKQIDDIIKEECGKSGLSDLKTLKQKKDFLKGLIEDKKKKLPEAWMKCTGYDLFQKYMKKIIQNYQQLITYHIEQDIDKILIDVQKFNNNFDKTMNALETINMRFKNFIVYQNNFSNIQKIITDNIKTKLEKITQLMNNYLITGINTYTGDTRENAESFLSKIGNKFYEKIKNLFPKSNPLAPSEEKLKLKRIELINNNLAEKYSSQDFTELYTTKTLDFNKYTLCVANTLDKKFMTFDKLLESVKKITNNDEKFMNVIINKFTSTYKSDTKFNEFLSNLELIANSTNFNIEYIWTIIECQLVANNSKNTNNIYNYWISLNSVNILEETPEIQYIMYKINMRNKIEDCEKYDFVLFKDRMNDMKNLYNLLKKLIGKKQNINDNDNKRKLNVQCKENKVFEMTDDEFLDATEGEKTEIENNESDKSEDCNETDDPTTIYQKTMRNAKVRTSKRVMKGGKIANVTK